MRNSLGYRLKDLILTGKKNPIAAPVTLPISVMAPITPELKPENVSQRCYSDLYFTQADQADSVVTVTLITHRQTKLIVLLQ